MEPAGMKTASKSAAMEPTSVEPSKSAAMEPAAMKPATASAMWTSISHA
jgi:hypothetical protein